MSDLTLTNAILDEPKALAINVPTRARKIAEGGE